MKHKGIFFFTSIVFLFIATFTSTPAVEAGKVKILRDSYGVPHIYAHNAYGLFYAFGYVAAEDRLFQLEISKRTALGKVAEIYGPDYLEFDMITRRDGYKITELEEQYQNLPKNYRRILKGYADGINRFIEEAKSNPSKMPKEFVDLGIEPSKWTPIEGIAPFIYTYGLQFMDAFVYPAELYNASLLSYLTNEYGEEQGAAMFEDAVWFDDPGAVTTIPEFECARLLANNKNSSSALLKEISMSGLKRVGESVARERVQLGNALNRLGMMTKYASNMIVVSPRKAFKRSSMLMGGPQFWYTVPGFLMEIGLHGAGFNCVGTTPLGLPFVMFGASKHHTWSSTYGVGNTADVYVETLNPDNPQQYWFNSKWKDMESRTEKFKVKDQADEVEELFYRTVHGPVFFFDLENNIAYSRRRVFEGQDMATWAAYLDSTRAYNLRDFRRAASKIAYSINWFYADKKGNIAYYYLGRYPIRPADLDDRLPTPGSGEYEWKGFLPFRALPSCVNPDQGYLVQWNNRPSAEWRNGDRQSSWGSVDRVQSIIDLLDAKKKVSFNDLKEVTRLVGLTDTSAKYFKPFICAATKKSDDHRVQIAVAYLKAWNNLRADDDNDGKYDNVGQTIFESWLPIMMRSTFEDEYGSFLNYSHPLASPTSTTKMLFHALEGKQSSLPPSVDYFNGEDPQTLILESLQQALNELENVFGSDMSQWKKDVVPTQFRSVNFKGIPQSFGIEYSIPYQNRGTQNHIVEFSKSSVKGVNINPPGQSGFINSYGELSPHYDDQLDMYADWVYKKMLIGKRCNPKNYETIVILKYNSHE
jgi:penicillin amidase